MQESSESFFSSRDVSVAVVASVLTLSIGGLFAWRFFDYQTELHQKEIDALNTAKKKEIDTLNTANQKEIASLRLSEETQKQQLNAISEAEIKIAALELEKNELITKLKTFCEVPKPQENSDSQEIELKIAGLQKEKQRLTAQVTEQATFIEEMRSELSQAMTKNQENKSLLIQLEQQKTLTVKQNESIIRLEKVNAENEKNKISIAKNEKLLVEKNIKITDLSAEIEKNVVTLEKQKQQIDTLEADKKALTEELSNLTQKNLTLEAQQEHLVFLEAENKKLQEQLLSLQQILNEKSLQVELPKITSSDASYKHIFTSQSQFPSAINTSSLLISDVEQSLQFSHLDEHSSDVNSGSLSSSEPSLSPRVSVQRIFSKPEKSDLESLNLNQEKKALVDKLAKMSKGKILNRGEILVIKCLIFHLLRYKNEKTIAQIFSDINVLLKPLLAEKNTDIKTQFPELYQIFIDSQDLKDVFTSQILTAKELRIFDRVLGRKADYFLQDATASNFFGDAYREEKKQLIKGEKVTEKQYTDNFLNKLNPLMSAGYVIR